MLLVQTCFLMTAICAHPALNQILPHLCVSVCVCMWGSCLSFVCLFVKLWLLTSSLLCGILQAIQEGILPQPPPIHPTSIKQAVLGIHQVSCNMQTLSHTQPLMTSFIF